LVIANYQRIVLILILNVEIESGLKQTVHCPDYLSSYTKEDNNCDVLITYCLWTTTIVYCHLRKSKLNTKRNNQNLILNGNAFYLQSINLMLCSVNWNNIYHYLLAPTNYKKLKLHDGLKNMTFSEYKSLCNRIVNKICRYKVPY